MVLPTAGERFGKTAQQEFILDGVAHRFVVLWPRAGLWSIACLNWSHSKWE
jgi:hypothetical protein